MRQPYVQAVDSQGGYVLWLAPEMPDEEVRFRAHGEREWRQAPIVRDTSGVIRATDTLYTRRARLGDFAPLTVVEYEVRSGRRSAGRAAFRTAPGNGAKATFAMSGPAGASAPPPSGVAASSPAPTAGAPATTAGAAATTAAAPATTAGAAAASASAPGSTAPTSPALLATPPDTVVVLAFGDSGWGSPAQIKLAELINRRPWDLSVHVGDIAYNSGSDEDFTLRHFRVYRNLMARVPFFPSPGNHDLRTDGPRPYQRSFQWPDPRPGALYYAFRWADILFVALDTNDETGEGIALRSGEGAQLEWLGATLAEASEDPTLRWRVVYMHHPLYSHAAGISGHGSDVELRKVLAPIFERYGVDLVLQGHDHHYERSRPVLEETAVPRGCGPVYVLTGGGGASTFARSLRRTALAARLSYKHHYVRLAFGAETIRGTAVDENGRTIDRFAVRPYPGRQVEPAASCRLTD